eukprot:1137324-Pelagomonas_calceolata.AAC.3
MQFLSKHTFVKSSSDHSRESPRGLKAWSLESRITQGRYLRSIKALFPKLFNPLSAMLKLSLFSQESLEYI